MAEPPSHPVDDNPDAPDDRFLMALWDLLERALELSTASDVLEHIDEVRGCCEAAAALCRTRSGGG